MKAYLIDSVNNIVKTLEITSDYHEIIKAIGCELFCVGRTLPNGDTVYVDDEGWLKSEVTRAFIFDGQLLAGNGIVIGLNRNNGESESVKTSEAEIKALVQFAPLGFTITDEMRDKAMSSWTVTTF